MENKDLARIFSEMADILELKEENPFRIRAFRRTAQILENLSFNAARAAQEEEEQLRAISGIGEGTIKKIKEILETGRCREHVELRSEIPPSLLTLLELQNLGPKIKLLYRMTTHLGILIVWLVEQRDLSNNSLSKLIPSAK